MTFKELIDKLKELEAWGIKEGQSGYVDGIRDAIKVAYYYTK